MSNVIKQRYPLKRVFKQVFNDAVLVWRILPCHHVVNSVISVKYIQIKNDAMAFCTKKSASLTVHSALYQLTNLSYQTFQSALKGLDGYLQSLLLHLHDQNAAQRQHCQFSLMQIYFLLQQSSVQVWVQAFASLFSLNGHFLDEHFQLDNQQMVYSDSKKWS